MLGSLARSLFGSANERKVRPLIAAVPKINALEPRFQAMTDAELAANRCQFGQDILTHPEDDAYHRERSAQWDTITVPFLSAGNWGGQGLHLRGNSESFMRAASKHKWLEMHGLEHWTHFYTDYGIQIQKRFFAHFLKGEANGWDQEPPVRLQVRHP